MRNVFRLGMVLIIGAAIAGGGFSLSDDKLPRCSKPMCRSVGCSPDVLCASGTTVKSCAEVCKH